MGERSYFGAQFEGMSHHGWEVLVQELMEVGHIATMVRKQVMIGANAQVHFPVLYCSIVYVILPTSTILM